MTVRIHYKNGVTQDIPVDTCSDEDTLQDQISKYLSQRQQFIFTKKSYKIDQAIQLFDKNLTIVAQLVQSPDIDYMECI
jgi:hypothetical protein